MWAFGYASLTAFMAGVDNSTSPILSVLIRSILRSRFFSFTQYIPCGFKYLFGFYRFHTFKVIPALGDLARGTMKPFTESRSQSLSRAVFPVIGWAEYRHRRRPD